MLNSDAFVPVIAILPRLKLADPSFLMVAIWGVEEEPTLTFPKLRERGVTVMSGRFKETPVPARLIVTGFSSGSFEGMLELLKKEHIEVGEKVYVTLHEAPGERVKPEQLSADLLKGGEGNVIVPIVKLAFPTFDTVTDCAGLLPMFTLPKLIEARLTEMSASGGRPKGSD